MKRLKVFSAVSLPVIDYYYKRGKLYKVLNLGDDHWLIMVFGKLLYNCFVVVYLSWCILCPFFLYVLTFYLFPSLHHLAFFSFLFFFLLNFIQIDGTGTEDEVYRRVYGVFAALKYDFLYLGNMIEYFSFSILSHILPSNLYSYITCRFRWILKTSFAGLNNSLLMKCQKKKYAFTLHLNYGERNNLRTFF